MSTITLTVIEGPNGGRFLRAPLGQTPVVGRGSSSDFSVIDPRMSREHFKLLGEGSAWRVRDLESANGTLLNQEQVEEADLQADDVITAGDTKFRVTFDESELVSDLVVASGGKEDKQARERRTWKDLLTTRRKREADPPMDTQTT